MWYSEIGARTANSWMESSINELSIEDHPLLTDTLNVLEAMCQQERLGYEANSGGLSLTDFRLQSYGQGLAGSEKLVPTLVYDQDKVLILGAEATRYDLVRTLFLIAQYPDQGYERRIADVYKEAINRQKAYLEAVNASRDHVVLDPRKHHVDRLTLLLIGNALYYKNVGFNDFQDAIERKERNGEISRLQLAALNRVYEDKAGFVHLREFEGRRVYRDIVEKGGEAEFAGWSSERRAKHMAERLVSKVIAAPVNQDGGLW